jgi:hypothetical protein
MRTDAAIARAEEHIRAAAARLLPEPALVLQTAAVDPCDDPTDGGPPGLVFVVRRYRVYGSGPHAFDALAAYWTGHGYRILDDQRGAAHPYLWAEHAGDGYRVGLDTTLAGELLLGASSPCLGPDPD